MSEQFLFDENEYAQRTYVEDGEYAPTTEVLRATYATDYYMTNVWGGPGVTVSGRAAAFDRWLAQHDAEVAAKALQSRELHHFESEQAMEEALAAIRNGEYRRAERILQEATK